MPAQQVLFRSAAREKVVTLGPRSKSVPIQTRSGSPIVCNDGATITKQFDLKDPGQDLGAQMLRQAAERTGNAVAEEVEAVAGSRGFDAARKEYLDLAGPAEMPQ